MFDLFWASNPSDKQILDAIAIIHRVLGIGPQGEVDRLLESEGIVVREGDER